MPFDQITLAVAKLKSSEATFKKRFERIIFNPANQDFIEEDDRKKAMEFLAKDFEYFRSPDYLNSQIELLTECLNIFFTVSNERVFHAKANVFEDSG